MPAERETRRTPFYRIEEARIGDAYLGARRKARIGTIDKVGGKGIFAESGRLLALPKKSTCTDHQGNSPCH